MSWKQIDNDEMASGSFPYLAMALALAVPALAADPPCDQGSFELDSTSTSAGRPVRFFADDSLGYCSGLSVTSIEVEDGRVNVALLAAEAGPAACGGGMVEGTLPLLAPGAYEVAASLTVGGQPSCQLGTAALVVTASLSSMLDNSDFDRGLEAWAATSGWTAESGVVRSGGGFGQLAQCVPVAPGERYVVSASARGEGGSAGIGVGVWSYYGSCPSLPVDPSGTGTIQAVGSGAFEAVELEYVSPTPPTPTLQVYAGISVFDEGTGSPLLVDSVTVQRPDCPASAEVACLHGGRFEARLGWQAFDDSNGPGRIVSAVNDSSLWWFFEPTNWEMVVKVLRGCALGRHWWVFAAGATNVEWTLDVDDTSTGASWSYQNPLGERSPAVTETAAIACASSE
jgi:hypothetical protein